MKLYLFDTINRYKRYSETLDVKTKICNRPWIVFNDGGEREVYKFKEDGTINIVLSGRVTRGTWEYDPTDKTIIISASEQSYMVHPGMYDDMLLALQVDGTDQCAFLIEENNSKNFAPKTYSELMLFFEEKEKKRIKEERIRNKAEKEAQQKRLEEDRRRKEIEAEQRRRYEEELNRRQTTVVHNNQEEKGCLTLVLGPLLLGGVIVGIFSILLYGLSQTFPVKDYLLLYAILAMAFPILLYIIGKNKFDK